MQLDLDGLVKTLNEHCKKYGLRRKPTTLTELPFEGAADWDEDWDKFEDKCMPKMSYYRNHHQFRKKKLPQLRVQQQLLHLKLMFSQKSLKMRMTRPLKMEQHMIKMKASQQKVLRTVHLLAVLLEGHLENFQILTMQRQQTQMPHPVIRNLKGSDEPAWGTFDNNDDVDSVWGFSAVSTTKDMDQESLLFWPWGVRPQPYQDWVITRRWLFPEEPPFHFRRFCS